MKRIASFCVDHNKLDRGIYISRVDGDIVTYDIRMKKPNVPPFIEVAAMHTIEHLFATYARNSAISDKVIYFGPMGCRTGCYLLLRDATHEQAIELIKETFEFIAKFDGEIPGTTAVECGNYLEHDLQGAVAEAREYLPVIKDYTVELLSYER